MSHDPFTVDRGRTQMRIVPTNFTATGTNVFCFGSDLSTPPVFDLNPNAAIELVSPTIGVDAGSKLVRFKSGFRQPKDMPSKRTVPAGSTLVRGNVLSTGDDLSALRTVADFFTSTDLRRVVRVTGAANPANNADFRIVGVPTARIAVLSPVLAAATNDSGFGAISPGYIWEAQIQMEDPATPGAYITVHKLRLLRGENRRKVDLAVNLAGAGANTTLRYRYLLVEET